MKILLQTVTQKGINT